MKKMFQLVAGILLMGAALPAMAVQPPVSVPEPMSLSLLAIGAGGVAIVRALRRKG